MLTVGPIYLVIRFGKYESKKGSITLTSVGDFAAVLRKDPKDQAASLREAAMRQDSRAAADARSAGNFGEVSLVREVLCACQAFDGEHVRYKGAAKKGLGGFEIAAAAGIPPVQRSLMLKLCELGWLFR